VKIRRIFLALTILAALMVFSGCQDNHELDSMLLITAVAFDVAEDDMWNVTIEAVKTSNVESGIPVKTTLLSGSGRTISEVGKELERKAGASLYWGHTEAVVLGKSAANGRLHEVLDWVLRDNEARLVIKLLVSENETAEEILEVEAEANGTIGATLAKIIANSEFCDDFTDTTVILITNSLMNGGDAAVVVPAVEVCEDGGRQMCRISGGVVLRSDTEHMLGVLPVADITDCMLVIGRYRGGNEVFSDGSREFSADIISAKSQTRANLVGNRLVFKVEISANLSLTYLQSDEKLTQEELLRLTEVAESAMEQRISATFARLQNELKADITDFREAVMRDLGEFWGENTFTDFFLAAEIHVSVEFTMADTGLTGSAPEVGTGEKYG